MTAPLPNPVGGDAALPAPGDDDSRVAAISSGTADVGALLAEACALGRPTLLQSDDGRWIAWIKFATLPGASLEASSGFDATPAGALWDAIGKARAIRAAFRD